MHHLQFLLRFRVVFSGLCFFAFSVVLEKEKCMSLNDQGNSNRRTTYNNKQVGFEKNLFFSKC